MCMHVLCVTESDWSPFECIKVYALLPPQKSYCIHSKESSHEHISNPSRMWSRLLFKKNKTSYIHRAVVSCSKFGYLLSVSTISPARRGLFMPALALEIWYVCANATSSGKSKLRHSMAYLNYNNISLAIDLWILLYTLIAIRTKTQLFWTENIACLIRSNISNFPYIWILNLATQCIFSTLFTT